MKFLVVGCGSIGRRHIGNLRSLGVEELTAFDISPERRKAVAKEFGVSSFSSLSAALAAAPNVVFVTTPTSSHVPVALEAAARGCHLFIEKPLSHNLEGIARLLSLVGTNRLVTLVGCNLRFHPGLVKVKELLEEGTVGTMVSARVQAGQWLPDWHPREDYRQGYSAKRQLGGGIILDDIHEIDYIQWLVGSPVRKVACFSGRLSSLEIDTEDTAAIVLGFANGTIGEVHVDYVQRSYDRSCQIIGDEGTVCWDYSSGRVYWYSAAVGQWQDFLCAHGWDPNQMYLDEAGHFLRCLAGEEQPALDVRAAVEVLKVALAAKRSSDCNQVVFNEVDEPWPLE